MASLQDQNTVARRLILELREGLVCFACCTRRMRVACQWLSAARHALPRSGLSAWRAAAALRLRLHVS